MTAIVAISFIGLSLAAIGGLRATAVSAQSPGEPVPCEVAMVVGCVASIAGGNGSVSLTLQVSEVGGSQPTPDGPGPAGATAATPTADGTPEQGTSGQGAQQLEQPEQSDRPLQTTIDPWERGGLESNFGTNSIPISHYQIGADVTGWLGVPDPLDSFVASQTNWAFTTSTFLVILATNALDWAFEFPLAEDLVGDAGVLAQSYTVDFLGFGLATSVYGLALSVTMVVAGFKAVTKGVIAAGSEVLVAFAAYVVLIVLTLTSGFGNAGLTVSRLSSDLAGSIASFASGQERQQDCAVELRPDGDAVPLAGAEAATDPAAGGAGVSSACSFGFAIQRSLVELPYQNLQWGQVLDGVGGKERCSAINLELLAEGPWGNDDEPRDRMRAAPECEENADFNHQATYIRLGIASANTIAAAAVTLLVLIVAAMLLWQQIKLLFLTVTMPHALVFAILPGRSRKLAWQWIEHFVGVVIRTVILSLGLVIWLSLFSLIVYEQLTLQGIFLSLFASIAMAISGFYGLYQMSGMTRRINPAAGRQGDRPTITGQGTGQGAGRGADRGAERGADRGDEAGGSVGRRLLEDRARSTMRTVRSRQGSASTWRTGSSTTSTDPPPPTRTPGRTGPSRPTVEATTDGGAGSATGTGSRTATLGPGRGSGAAASTVGTTSRGGPGDQSGDGAAAPTRGDPAGRSSPIGAGRP